MSVKNNKTNTKIVIQYTESKRDAERKFQVKYSARTILLILLGKSFAYLWRVPGLGILNRPPQDLVAVLDFEIPCSRPETPGLFITDLCFQDGEDGDVLRSPDLRCENLKILHAINHTSLAFTVVIVGLYYFIFLMKPRYLNKIE